MRPLNMGGVVQSRAQWCALRHCGCSTVLTDVHDKSVETFGYCILTTEDASQSKGVLWAQIMTVYVPVTEKKNILTLIDRLLLS